MKQYWIHFKKSENPNPFNLGCGVTANDLFDAIAVIEQNGVRMRVKQEILMIKRIFEMVELDQKHVIPNIGNHLKRGIWFPLGF